MMSERETQRTSLCIKTGTNWYSSVDFNISPICGAHNVNLYEMCCRVLSSTSEVTVGHMDVISSLIYPHNETIEM
jgi:hypothetical protein